MTAAADDDAGRRAIDGREALAAARLQLLAGARHRLSLHLPLLAHEDYGNDAELAELKRIATSGRRAEIRILLHDPAAALRDGHRLIALFQRLPSTILIRTPVEDVDRQNAGAWLLTDGGGYFFLPEAARPQGRMALADRAAQAPLQQQFDEIWERSARASELQPLDL
ncbi:MAG: hypothetical protein BGP10_15540 [Rhodanobacter sp. 68-29]|uniref:DUF7931 domain-containing protein n=1 Tax=Rhodanobacter sp. PCA2 TaxID=2006117 RepID=UPI00086ECD25|nr:hypothetical protein [Rhodanobacter sp. PCA2]MBN8921681.1 hypothetical protein [Rhodanobacter sp.]ODV27815.1 MAG: hypothetical protein ABT19_01105 [Rhodanobacter sp. SCN 68-63]OJY61325.1 MAG: hypothetical protein BGP10_15540 [Rhodanobacter sp. 68-29]